MQNNATLKKGCPGRTDLPVSMDASMSATIPGKWQRSPSPQQGVPAASKVKNQPAIINSDIFC